MDFCTVAYVENGTKKMSTVPRNWFYNGTLYWPNDRNKEKLWYKNSEPPKSDWFQVHGATLLKEGIK